MCNTPRRKFALIDKPPDPALNLRMYDTCMKSNHPSINFCKTEPETVEAKKLHQNLKTELRKIEKREKRKKEKRRNRRKQGRKNKNKRKKKNEKKSNRRNRQNRRKRLKDHIKDFLKDRKEKKEKEKFQRSKPSSMHFV